MEPSTITSAFGSALYRLTGLRTGNESRAPATANLFATHRSARRPGNDGVQPLATHRGTRRAGRLRRLSLAQRRPDRADLVEDGEAFGVGVVEVGCDADAGAGAVVDDEAAPDQ